MPREILHIGLGSSACHVTAHYLNLQGLSVTSPHGDDQFTPSCDASISHAPRQRVLVPRTLLVDTDEDASSCSLDVKNDKNDATSDVHDDLIMTLPKVEVLSTQELQAIQPSNLWSGTTERVDLRAPHQQQQSVDPRLVAFRETATQLSFASQSRYRAPVASKSAAPTSYSINSNNSRTVDWDNMSEEEDEEDEEERRMLEQRQQNHWNQQVYPQLQDQMDAFWGNALGSVEVSKEESLYPKKDATNEGTSTEAPLAKIRSWREFWMPPYHPDSILNLPFKNADRSDWDYYYPVSQNTGAVVDRSWLEDSLLERIRHMLEDCDSCQGVTLAASGHGVHAGLTTQVLQYLKDDCPSARRWVWSLDNSDTASSGTDQEDPSWRTRRVEKTRHDMELGLMWQDYLESAHSILTLKLPLLPTVPSQHNSMFHRTAILGAALETVTLPYRLSKTSSAKRRLGLNSYYYGSFAGDSPFGSTDCLTLSEFLKNLMPSPGLTVLELDVMLPSSSGSGSPLEARLLEGTSYERDQRMKSKPQMSGVHRPRDVDPGEWMMDPSQGGILSSLSPKRESDRSVHTHFALATALRYNPPSASTCTSSNYVDCMMQGMGIRFRPEQSLALHLGEGLGTLTSGGYGAGSYWKHAWGPAAPVLSVLGNTTRFYSQANDIGTGVKASLGPASRGFLNRDVSNDVLPEPDNCHEVLSSIYDIRDKYRPPSGMDEDDVFMD